MPLETRLSALATRLGQAMKLRQLLSEKGAANGYAGLDANAKVPIAQLPTIAGTNQWTTVGKATTTTRTATIVLAADPDLTFALAANTRYRFRLTAFVDTSALGDFKFRHAGPATPTLVRIQRHHIVPASPVTLVNAVDVAYSAADVALAGTGTTGGYTRLEGIIHNGATAGAFQFLWAQNTSDAGSTSVLAGSYLEWTAV